MGKEYPFFLTLKKSIVLKLITLNPRLVSLVRFSLVSLVVLYRLNFKNMEANDIFSEVLTDLRSVINAADKETRTYNRKNTPDEYYTPEYARYKLVIYFKDGRSRWYYSYDLIKFQNFKHLDEFESLKKLLRVVKNAAGSYKTAVIYATTDVKPEANKSNYNFMIAKYDFYQNYLSNPFVEFKPTNDDLKLDLFKLSTGPKVLTKN